MSTGIEHSSTNHWPTLVAHPVGLIVASGSHEQAAGLLLLAAATETGLLIQLEQALPPPPAPPEPPCFPLAGSTAVRQRLLLTLLFLGAVGISRTWDLRRYTADGLALLTGRKRAYGYRYTEAFLSQIARANGAERFTNALACWATHLWHSTEETEKVEHPHALTRAIASKFRATETSSKRTEIKSSSRVFFLMKSRRSGSMPRGEPTLGEISTLRG